MFNEMTKSVLNYKLNAFSPYAVSLYVPVAAQDLFLKSYRLVDHLGCLMFDDKGDALTRSPRTAT